MWVKEQPVPVAPCVEEASPACGHIDLRNWLFGFGAGIRVDSPEALRDEHRQKLQNALEVYQSA